MNAEQKQRAAELLAAWRATAYALHADCMAALLQEMVNTPAEAPADVARDADPVGYLYTHVQSGEYHVSDYDDDYRGPERAMWHIEPVYRRAKGQA